eukprot:3313701-Pyramimonas_sp.AAC.1
MASAPRGAARRPLHALAPPAGEAQLSGRGRGEQGPLSAPRAGDPTRRRFFAPPGPMGRPRGESIA